MKTIEEFTEAIATGRVRVSPRFTAILAFVLNIPDLTRPAINDMLVTSDGYLLAQHAGDAGMNVFVAHADTLTENLRGVAGVAEIDPALLIAAAERRITNYTG